MDLLSIIKSINEVLWGYVLIFLLCGTGIYFTVTLKFVQVRKFKAAFKKTFGGVKFGKKAGKDGMSSFQAMTTSIAAQVGTGNLAGAATAIVAGGPGAIFWMWMSAFFGMSIAFSEAVLAQLFKEKKDKQFLMPFNKFPYFLQDILHSDFLSSVPSNFFDCTPILPSAELEVTRYESYNAFAIITRTLPPTVPS